MNVQSKEKVQGKEKVQASQEITRLQQRIAKLEMQVAAHEQSEEKLARLATFPEQNPNLVIETNLKGEVIYVNPVAQSLFPDLWEKGAQHPLLTELITIIEGFQRGEREYIAREIDLETAVYEQKICATIASELIGVRIFAHDITTSKRAEEAIQELAKRVVLAQEEERHRISRELHDEAGQALTALKISVQLIQADLPVGADTTHQNLEEVASLVDVTREQIRLLARDLRPPALDTVGLNLTLEDVCRRFSKHTRLSIKYEGIQLPPLGEAITICLYRFLQEALTNVAKHAQATEVRVSLTCTEQLVSLLVADNGEGFDRPLNQLKKPSGIGLLGMQERVELLDGWLEISSIQGQGACLVAHLPLETLK